MRPALALVTVLFACGRGPGPSAAVATDSSLPTLPSPSVSSQVGDPPPAPTVVAPITAFFESLPVAGRADAFVSLPTGATGKRPVVVVIHGAGDRPDWQCGGWRRATGGYPFIVCPTGRIDPASSTRGDTRYTHAGGKVLLATIDGALEALAARYPTTRTRPRRCSPASRSGRGRSSPSRCSSPRAFRGSRSWRA